MVQVVLVLVLVMWLVLAEGLVPAAECLLQMVVQETFLLVMLFHPVWEVFLLKYLLKYLEQSYLV